MNYICSSLITEVLSSEQNVQRMGKVGFVWQLSHDQIQCFNHTLAWCHAIETYRYDLNQHWMLDMDTQMQPSFSWHDIVVRLWGALYILPICLRVIANPWPKIRLTVVFTQLDEQLWPIMRSPSLPLPRQVLDLWLFILNRKTWSHDMICFYAGIYGPWPYMGRHFMIITRLVSKCGRNCTLRSLYSGWHWLCSSGFLHSYWNNM